MWIIDMVHIPVVDPLEAGRVLLPMTHVNQDEPPSLIMDPCLLLGQLNELFAAEDSAEMAQETEQDGLLS